MDDLIERLGKNGTSVEQEFQKLILLPELSDNDNIQDIIFKLYVTESVKQYSYPFSTLSDFDKSYFEDALYNEQLNTLQQKLSEHLLAVGQSGSGKTTLLRNLMCEVEEPFWAFDLKQDYRQLSRDGDALVLPWGELRFNPLRLPEGVSVMRWAQVFSEVFCHSTSLFSGSKNYVLKQVLRLYKLYGLFDGSR